MTGRPDAGPTVLVDLSSRRHLAFQVSDGAVLVEDLGSRNGTVLRQKSADTALSAGQRLPVGRHDTVALPAGITIERSGRLVPNEDDTDDAERPNGHETDRSTRLLGRTQR